MRAVPESYARCLRREKVRVDPDRIRTRLTGFASAAQGPGYRPSEEEP